METICSSLSIIVFEYLQESIIMSYADAARNESNGNAGNTARENIFGKYFNEKMLVCYAAGFTCEDVADVMHKQALLQVVTGRQSFDFNRRIGMEIDDQGVRDRIATSGVDIKNRHITFEFHKRREIKRVFVTQLPLGICCQELRVSFVTYGHIVSIQPVTKSYHGRKVYTGDWCIFFDVFLKPIPSYVIVRGWKVYVNYHGQSRTCRICDGPGHIAKDCLTKNRDDDQDQPVNMDVHEQPLPNEPDPENLGEPESNEGILERVVTLEDCQTPSSLELEFQQEAQEPDGQSQAWADSPEGDPYY